MSAEDQVRLPEGVTPVAGELELTSSADVAHDPGGRACDQVHLDQPADRAERLSPPRLRRGRPPIGSTSGRSPRLSTRVPREVDAAVRAAAADDGTTPGRWLRGAINQQLARR